MHLRCGGIFNHCFHYAFTAESEGEGILKIGQHLAKLWARVGCPVFDSRGITKTP